MMIGSNATKAVHTAQLQSHKAAAKSVNHDLKAGDNFRADAMTLNATYPGLVLAASETIPQISFGQYSQPVGLAADASDNIWVTDDSHSTVFEIPAGSSEPQNAGLTQLKGPTGISFDASGDLYVTNFGGNNAAIYAPGSQSPTATITNGMQGPTYNTVTSSGKFFQGNQGEVPPSSGDIQGYPSGQNQPSSFIEIPETQGLAAAPIALQKRKVHHL
jgi:hypothetical protein